jgi:hypothetical protein
MCRDFNLDNLSGGCYAIQQGATLDWLTLFYKDQDITSWSPSGEIRNKYAYQGGVVLANFSFDPLLYGSVTEGGETFTATIIHPYLSATDTLSLPITLSRTSSDRVIVGRNAFVYDLKLESPNGEVIMVAKGLIEVMPDVTRR